MDTSIFGKCYFFFISRWIDVNFHYGVGFRAMTSSGRDKLPCCPLYSTRFLFWGVKGLSNQLVLVSALLSGLGSSLPVVSISVDIKGSLP